MFPVGQLTYNFLDDHGYEDSRFAIPLVVAIQFACEEVPGIPMSPMAGTRQWEDPRQGNYPLLTSATGGSNRRTRVKRVTLPRVTISDSV